MPAAFPQGTPAIQETQGSPAHGVIHTELRRVCGGPPSAEATAGQLNERIKKVREWATRMK